VSPRKKICLNLWYLYDGCIGGDPQTVLENAVKVRKDLFSTDLEANILNVSGSLTPKSKDHQTSELLHHAIVGILSA